MSIGRSKGSPKKKIIFFVSNFVFYEKYLSYNSHWNFYIFYSKLSNQNHFIPREENLLST